MAGKQAGADNERNRKQKYERPPDEDPTRHGSDLSRRSPPEPLYLDGADFAALWPGIEARLHRRLVRDGLDPDAARDLCQDVATAFLRAPQRVRTREELVERALLAGYRLSRRLRQRDSRIQLGDLPDMAVPDVADDVERRYIVEAMAEALHNLHRRDRQVLLQDSSPAMLSPIERNRFYVRLHRARRRLRDRLRGWLVGVYVGRYLPFRDDLLAEGFRAVCFSAAAVLVVGATILHNNSPQPAAAAPGAKQNDHAQVDRALRVAVGAIPSHALAPQVANLGIGPVRPQRKEARIADGATEHEQPSHSVTVVGQPLGTEAETGTARRPPGNDSVVCLSGLRVAPDVCVQHPLRKDDGSIIPQS
jgi:hypothetical protein